MEEKVATQKVGPVAEPEPSHYIMLKDCTYPSGFQLVMLKRGDIIEDPHIIRQIKAAYVNTKLPMRPLTERDIADGGLL